MNKAYIDNKLAGIFEPMVNHIVQDQPHDIVKTLNDFILNNDKQVDYMIKYLKENYGNRPSSKYQYQMHN